MVGLRLNAKQTKVITYSIQKERPPVTTAEGEALGEVNDFKCLGSWVNSTEQDLTVRKALAWRSLNSMASVWKSISVESVLLHGSDCWTLKTTL